MNNLTNSHSFPVLEKGKFDYKDDSIYEIEQIKNDSKSNYIIFEHHLKGDNLISQFLRSNEAKFVTTVVQKSTMYRETIDSILESKSPVKIWQEVPLKTTLETQNFLSSIVYIGENKKITLNSETMGLDDFWDGITIELKKGAILARDDWRELESTASDLLTIRRDDTIKYGFDVDVISEEGGRFMANVQPELYDKIKQLSRDNSHLRSLVIHMLCIGFMNLAKDFKEDDSELTNFKGIKSDLENKGIKTWSEDDFNANQVACYFLRHNIKLEEENE